MDAIDAVMFVAMGLLIERKIIYDHYGKC